MNPDTQGMTNNIDFHKNIKTLDLLQYKSFII